MTYHGERCNHVWGPIFWGTKTEYIPYGYRQVKQGSDIWGEPEGYREEEKSCQMTICTKCGAKKYL